MRNNLRKVGRGRALVSKSAADGNTQKYGVDFDRIFSTVVKSTTIRMVLIIACSKGWHLSAIDIAQAYLQAELSEELYMMVPPLIPAYDTNGDKLVCKLNRSLYGLRQAGREWNILLVKFIIEWGFLQSSVDVCLFTYKSGEDVIWILIYVDDIMVASSSQPLRKRFVGDLSKRFPTEDRGPLKWILGISIDYSPGRIAMGQSLFVTDLLEKFAPHVAAGHARKLTPRRTTQSSSMPHNVRLMVRQNMSTCSHDVPTTIPSLVRCCGWPT